MAEISVGRRVNQPSPGSMKPNPPNLVKPDGSGKRAWQPPSLAEMQALLPQFQFIALLGRGGMGAVYRATQLSLKRPVAIKALPGELLADAEADFAARFRKEALTMAKLNHPGIVSVYESGEAGGLLYIVMEFVDGTDVGRMIHGEGRLAPELVTQLLTQVCEALHYAHEQGVVHRDLKPANLLLTREGRVKIADFGLAKHNDDALLALTKTNVAVGTPDFLAPEAWTPGTPLDGRADLYSLGVTLYQMLTGEVPRGLWKMPSVRAGVDERFDAIIDRAMQPDREARYQSSAELRRDLEQIRVAPHDARRSSKAGPAAKRRKVLMAAAAVFVLILAAILWPQASIPKASPELRAAAQWLVREKAEFRILTRRGEIEVKAEADLPDRFEIVYLWFDRWKSSPPKTPPPAAEFAALDTVTTLRFVWVRMPGLPESAYAFLASNPKLRRVSIEGNPEVTDHVLSFVTGLPELEELSITGGRGFTGRGLSNATWRATVRHCDFMGSKLNDDGLRAVAGCPELAEVMVDETLITGEGLASLASLPKLTHLSAGNCRNLGPADYAAVLPQMHRLTELRLLHANFDDQSAAGVAMLTNLTNLKLFSNQMTDAGLAKLTTLTRLKYLYVGDTAVTLEGIAAFTNALPQCEVEK